MNIKVRSCKKADYPFYYRIIKETLFPIITKYHKPDPQRVRVDFERDYKEIKILTKGKRSIGFYQLRPKGKTLEIVKIFLSPAYQGRGIGKTYMKYFETLGYNKLILQVWDNNPARFVYKKLGYKTTRKQNHKIHMEKKLKPSRAYSQR